MTSKKLQDRIYAVRGNQIYYCKFGKPTNPFSNVTWQKKNHGIINVRVFFFVKSKFKPWEWFKLAACEDNTQKLGTWSYNINCLLCVNQRKHNFIENNLHLQRDRSVLFSIMTNAFIGSTASDGVGFYRISK